MRLLSINAPDRGECFFEEGLDHLIDTLKGATVSLDATGVDQFGRTLAHVFSGERHINLEMVEQGLALASTPDANDPYGAPILDAEEVAYSSGTGLWSPDACGASVPLPEVSIDRADSETDPRGDDRLDLAMEVIVVTNTGPTDVDLSGWILRDESSRHRFTFEAGTYIPANGTYEVASEDAGWEPGGDAVWNNDGDMALLQLPNGTVVDRWRY